MQAGNTASTTVIGIEYGLTIGSTAKRSILGVVHVGPNIISSIGFKGSILFFFPSTMLEQVSVLWGMDPSYMLNSFGERRV